MAAADQSPQPGKYGCCPRTTHASTCGLEPGQKKCKESRKAMAIPAGTLLKTSCSLVSSLPLEIKFMIFDLLDHRTVKEMLVAIPWEVPDLYWRMRLYSGILFEVRWLDPELVLDWQLLCLKSEALCETMKALRNRKRIIDILKDIAKPFWAGLNSDDQRELQELTKEKRERRLTEEATQKPRKKRRRR